MEQENKPTEEAPGQKAVQAPTPPAEEATAAEPAVEALKAPSPNTEDPEPEEPIPPTSLPVGGPMKASPKLDVPEEAVPTPEESVAAPPPAEAPPPPVVLLPPAAVAPVDPPAPVVAIPHPATPAEASSELGESKEVPQAAENGGVDKSEEATGPALPEVEGVRAPETAQPINLTPAIAANSAPLAAAPVGAGAKADEVAIKLQEDRRRMLAAQAQMGQMTPQQAAYLQQVQSMAQMGQMATPAQFASFQQQQVIAQRNAAVQQQQASQHAVQVAAQRGAQQVEGKGSQAAMQAGGMGDQPRRASGRAFQSVKNQDDYFSDSPPDSPIDEEPQAKKPTPLKAKPVAKPAQSVDDSQVSGWEEPPKKQLALKFSDLTKRLEKKWLQIYWPDDGKWWPCQVALVDIRKKTATLIYETGEEEADLELAELIAKGEVAWLNDSDAPKDKEAMSSGRRGGRPPASWKSDDYDDEPVTSRGRGKGQADDEDYEEEEEEEPWEPGKKRRAAIKSKSRYREPSEAADSSDSDSPPPSDQSSDWHSSDEDDKPRRKPKKKKKKTNVPRAQMHSHHHSHQQAHPRQHPAAHVHSSQQVGGSGSNLYASRNSIFNDDGPGTFGSTFGGVADQNAHRMPGSQVNPSMPRDNLQGFSMERNWTGPGSTGNPNTVSYPGGWGRGQGQSAEVSQLLQRQQQQQQMGSAGMGQLHIPQVSMQGAGGLFANNPQLARLNPGQGMNQWRGATPGSVDWAASLGPQSLFRMPAQQASLPQMSQQLASLPQMSQQLGGLPQMSQQMMMQQQQFMRQQAMMQQQQQAVAQQQQQQGHQTQQPAPQQAQPPQAAPQRTAVNPVIAASATKNMEGIVAQGMNGTGRRVEVQQANGSWLKGTVMASMGKDGGLVMVSLENGLQNQYLAADEGKSFNIKSTPTA